MWKEKPAVWKERQKKFRVKIKEKVGVIPLEAKADQGLPAIRRSQEAGMEQTLPHSPQKAQPCQRFGFRLLVSRTIRQSFSAVSSHPACGTLLYQLSEMNSLSIY